MATGSSLTLANPRCVRKSESTLPPFFREWVSVAEEFVTEKPEWQKLKRREAVCGYPRMDIFHDWLMDFASISANQLGRSDWRNFRRMLLIHVPACPSIAGIVSTMRGLVHQHPIQTSVRGPALRPLVRFRYRRSSRNSSPTRLGICQL